MKMYYVAEVLDWFENISLCWNDVTFTSHDGCEYTYTWLDAANEIWVQIDACRGYSGYDPSEDFSGSDTRAYKTENWNQRRLWRSVIKNYLLPYRDW